MTKEEIMIQIFNEILGPQKWRVPEIVKVIKNYGESNKWSDELSDKLSQVMLDELREEKEGILNWLVNGPMKEIANR